MDLFFSPLACSMSVRIALAEAGAPVNFIEVDPDTKRVLATGEDYRAVNPLGYVPALRLDDGTVLTENAAILQFITDEHPAAGLAPPASDRLAGAKLRQWLSFIGAELHKALLTPLVGRETPPEVRAWTVRKYAGRFAYLDDKLMGREFLLDRFSVADAYLATILNWTQSTPRSTSAPTRTSRPISRACASARASPRRWPSRSHCSARKSRDGRRPDAWARSPTRSRQFCPAPSARVLAAQPLNAVELAAIAGDDDEGAADRTSLPLVRTANVSGMMGRRDWHSGGTLIT